MDKNQKIIFYVRLALFILIGCVAPFAFIAWRFGLFASATKASLSGWGIVGILIIFFFLRYVYSILRSGIPYSFITQILAGVFKIIVPLLLMYVALNVIGRNIDQFMQVIVCVILCEIVAIPINPLPKYMHDNNIEKVESLMDTFWKKRKEHE